MTGDSTAPVYVSLLFETADAASALADAQPESFRDLNLDQIVAGVAGEGDPHHLVPWLYTPAPDVSTIERRHSVFRDLEDSSCREAAHDFVDGIRRMRECRARIDAAHHHHEQTRWLVESAVHYCSVVEIFGEALKKAAPRSAALQAALDDVTAYVASDGFRSLAETARQRLHEVRALRYDMLIVDGRVEVSRFADEPDYGETIAATFERFRRGEATERHQDFGDTVVLNSVETRVLEQVTQLFPDVFAPFDAFVHDYNNYMNPVIERLDHELQFYLHYRRYIAPVTAAGLRLCYPAMVAPGETIEARDAFDLALARQQAEDETPTVPNDFTLDPPERLIVVSGPNQGGKTTFARMIGQLHYLARLGCPVPGRKASLMCWRGLYTHFERAEDIRNLRGKLEDDLVRMHAILDMADDASLVIMNEIFSSTTSDDALYLGERMLRALLAAGATGVCVTFIDELAGLDEALVSMASTVDPRDPAVRTFRIERRPADGRAYARSLAEKHRLTREALEERL